MTLLTWLGVALAGGVGSVLRFLVDEAVRARVPGASFPRGILVVNVSGALLLGLVSGLALPHDASLIVGTALIGAYTTFSTWMLDTVNAASARLAGVAVANVLVSLALGLAAAALGRALGAGWA
ncbi:fluoride efflux transporter CrcB [Patulibacter minatonensis]|uniref:fluoride efflux transporter CrcB n=1 Tax=Patulibacter minatonensis TaxID=298163 RepID=UPI00047CA4A1|nr:fluoride efflux transporter CrcB [Patulibacter minatonensis]